MCRRMQPLVIDRCIQLPGLSFLPEIAKNIAFHLLRCGAKPYRKSIIIFPTQSSPAQSGLSEVSSAASPPSVSMLSGGAVAVSTSGGTASPFREPLFLASHSSEGTPKICCDWQRHLFFYTFSLKNGNLNSIMSSPFAPSVFWSKWVSILLYSSLYRTLFGFVEALTSLCAMIRELKCGETAILGDMCLALRTM